MARRDRRTARDRVGSFDRTRVALFLALAVLLALSFLPRFAPVIRQGPQCTDLAAPIGGNNRSVLAQSGGDEQALGLELRLPNRIVASDQPLEINVTFANQDIGPVILYLTGTMPPLTRLQNDAGLSIEIRRVGTDQILSDNAAPRGAPQVYPSEDLHLLGSRARCTQVYSLSPQQLGAIGLTTGEYRIRAFYGNPSSGVLPLPASGQAPTATPAYSDQGVWVGQISSDEVLFSIVAPGAAPPPAAG